MKIDLLGWSSRGLRAPDVEIDVRQAGSTPCQVALVQMPNGTGKTTTLILLNAALSGDAENWPPEQVRQFRRRNDDRLEGQFIVKLLVDERPLTFELTLDFENGSARYRTTKLGSGGIVDGWEPPIEIRRFLTPEFLRLFIFDGEFAEGLFDPRKAEAERAIDALCQLYLLEDVADFAESIWETKSKGGPKTSSGLSRYQSEHRNKTRRLRSLEKQRAAAQERLQEHQDGAAKLEAKINQHLSSVEETRDEHTAALEKKGKADTELDAIAGQAMATLRMPSAIHQQFGVELVELKDNLDRLKLPENTSSQFFEELIGEEECICGREMTDGARQEITLRSKRYLDAAESGTINSLKADIEKFTKETEEGSSHSKLMASLKALGVARRSALEADQLVRSLKQKLIAEGDDQLKQWEAERESHIEQCDQISELLASINGASDPEFSIKLIKAEVEALQQKIAEITNTVTLKQKTNVLKNLLSKATESARDQIKMELVAEVNKRVHEILVNDPLEIEGIERSLRLAGQEGASVGQTLALGYTFLTSVLHRGNNDFPLVVDSPANPIDADVRENVATVIPGLCTQFVAFTINTEREGFLPALERSAETIKYLTLFRKTKGTERLMKSLPENGVTQTDTAVLVEGPDYFKSFGVKSEEEE